MTTLELVNSELAKVNARVEELTTRKAQILSQANDLFSENGANAAAELSIIETKLAQAPKQLDALNRQKASLELDELLPTVEPLFIELTQEHERLREYHRWMLYQSLLLEVAQSSTMRLENQYLPGIRNKINALLSALAQRGLAPETLNALRQRMNVHVQHKGFSWQEKGQLKQQAIADFHARWGLNNEALPYAPVMPSLAVLPEGFQYPQTTDGKWRVPQPNEVHNVGHQSGGKG